MVSLAQRVRTTSGRRPLVVVIALAALLVIGYATWSQLQRANRLPEGLIQVNGRLEGDRVTVASKFPGRIRRLAVREGDRVTAGQTVIELDDVQTAAQVEQAKHAFNALDAQVQAAHTSLAVLNLEVPLAIETAQAKVDRARAMLERATAVEREARSDLQRFRNLVEDQAVSTQQVDQAEVRWHVARNELTAARSQLAEATKELAHAELGWQRIRAQQNVVAALERQRDQAEAALDEAESILADLTITAPTDGTITTRMVDVGEVVAAGAPLFEIVDLDHLYLKVFVPELQIGKVRLGLPARVYTDAFPETPFGATVRHIASQAEFTPKEVQTPDERVKLIYAVKLYLDDNPDHRLTPGLPADAIIKWREDVAWERPR